MAKQHQPWRWRVAAFAAGAVLVGGGLGDLAARQGPPAQQGQQGGQGGRQGGGGRGQARDLTGLQATVGTGVISGTITTEGSASPVRRARVNLSGAELRPARSVMTDDNGRFVFSGLPAGRFTLSVSKPGFVNINYGAKRPGRPGTPIQLFEGQKLEKADIAIPRGSVITGIVIDEHGEPSPLTPVRVMRYVTRTGERTLENAGTDQTDDRGMYRVFGLTPGEYLVSAVPRNQGLAGLEAARGQIEQLMQQFMGGDMGGRGGRGGGAAGATGLGALMGGAGGAAGLGALLGGGAAGGRGGQALADQIAQLQQQMQQQDDQQSVAYAPVYFPGVPNPGAAASINLGIGEERGGVDFQLQLVRTADVRGSVISADGTLPQGTTVTLTPHQAGPSIPGVNTNTSRVGQDGRFSFSNVTPGQYTIGARAPVRAPADPNDPQAGRGGRGGQAGGPGGRGGLGNTVQVLWASSDVTVTGQDLNDVVLQLQTGMTITGRVAFESTTLAPPADLTRVRVSLTPRGSQNTEFGGVPPAQVDATGNFKITGVPPGRYVISANAPAGGGAGGIAGAAGGRGGGGRGGATGGIAGPAQPVGNWTLKSAIVGGRDTLDFPIDIRPNEDLGGAIVTFTDRMQEISGTLQDPTGRPTADYTIIVFAADNRYWTPQSRRIVSARPDTTGRFTVRNLPPGTYRITAVTDVENGEWFDPSFLEPLVGLSVPITLNAGERKTQDLRLAGGMP